MYSLRNSLYSTCTVTVIIIFNTKHQYDDYDDDADLDPGTGGRVAVAHFSPPDTLPPSLRQSWGKSNKPETEFTPQK